MADDERADETAQSSRSDGDLTAIPDGGLGETMPEWLRRPPAWRGMVVPELPEGVPDIVEDAPAAPQSDVSSEEPSDEVPPAPSAGPKVLPEPDRSPIDPSSLIELGDLPGWLVGLGQREMPVDTAMLPLAEDRVVPSIVTTPASDGIVLRSQAAEEPEHFNETPAGNGMRILVIAGVIVAVILIAFFIAQFG